LITKLYKGYKRDGGFKKDEWRRTYTTAKECLDDYLDETCLIFLRLVDNL